jgi:hypothetical protein
LPTALARFRQPVKLTLAGGREMPEKLEIEVLDGVVRASASGAFSLDNAKTFFQEILLRAREEGVDKILIDARGITIEISAMARFEFGSHMAEQHPYQIKIAFVGHKDAVWPDRFLENVSANRVVNAKVVTEIKEALNWLTE